MTMNCGSCGRTLTTGARQCVYCGSKLGPGGTAVDGPRELEPPRSSRSGSGWLRRIVIVLVLIGAAVVSFSVPLFPCKSCAPGTGQTPAACPGCLGKGKLTPVRYFTGGFETKP